MSQAKELDLKFLERSLQQQESARQAFFRDVKIASLLFLAFQFVIFFRFINLHEHGLRLDAQIARLRIDQQALGEVQGQLASLQETLRSGGAELSALLKEAPAKLRSQLVELNNQIMNLRRAPAEEITPPSPPESFPIFQQNMPIVNLPISPPFLAGLTDAELQILKTADPEQKKFTTLAARIVNRHIVPPVFAEINAKKQELLEQPYAAMKSEIVNTLHVQHNTLERFGFSSSAVEKQLEQMQDNFKALHFTPPATEIWWRTYASKGATFGAQAIDADKVVEQISQELRKPEEDLAKFDSQLTALIREGESRKEELNNEAQKLQNSYGEVHALLQNYAKPLSIVALEPKDTVVYYPVILAAVFTYLVGRYVLLHRRVGFLVQAYREIGVAEESLRFYFAGFPRLTPALPSQPAARRATFTTALIVGLCAAPAVLMAASAYWILTSPGLKESAPGVLYVIAGGFLIASYLVLVLRLLRPAGALPS